MQKITLFALAAGAAIGSGVAVVGSQVQAQGAPPPGMEHPGMGRPDMGMGRPGGGRMGFMRRMRQFALIYPTADRNLSGADVQKIAEGYLLYNGNHSWKVNAVTEEPTRVTFAFASPDGAPIAHFAVDRHTGRPERLD